MRTFVLAMVVSLGIGVGTIARAQDLNVAADQQALVVAPGSNKVTAYQGASTEEDGHTDWSLALDPSQCYWFSGVGGAGVKHLYFYLWNPANKRVADAKPDMPVVTMTYCPEVPGMFHLQAKTGEGHGQYAVAVYSKPAPPRAAPPPALDLGAVCDQQASIAAPGSTRVAPHFQGMGDRTDWSTALSPGTCYWIVGCGDPKTVKKMYLYLWGPDNRRITESKSDTPNAMIGHCPTMMGIYKVQGKIAGKGDYRVGIYAKKTQ